MDCISDFADIFASVIQGSVLGPASFIVSASDLQPAHQGNVLVKFADDTYVIVPGANSSTCERELTHAQTWAEGCAENTPLEINPPRRKTPQTVTPPPEMKRPSVS